MKTAHVTPFRVVAFERYDHPTVLASADILIDGTILLTGIRLIKDTQDSPFRIQSPQLAWRDSDGYRRYASPCRIYKPLRQAIAAAIIARLQQEGAAK